MSPDKPASALKARDNDCRDAANRLRAEAIATLGKLKVERPQCRTNPSL